MGIYVLNETPKVKVETKDEAQQAHPQDALPIEKSNDKKNDGKTIVIEGPLSHVYTKALNMAYSKEDYLMTMNSVEDSDKESDIDVKGDVYLYCCDSDDLNNGGLREVSDKLRIALDSSKGKKIIVAVECGLNVSTKVGLLNDFSSSIGIEMITIRKKAIGRLQQALEA